jgi:hypothetical protein
VLGIRIGILEDMRIRGHIPVGIYGECLHISELEWDSTCEFQRVRLEQEEDRDETALRTSVKDSFEG